MEEDADSLGKPASRVVLVEDQTMFRQMLASIVNVVEGCKVVGEFTSGEDALAGAPGLKPDLAVVDIMLPGLSGVELVRQVREALKDARVLVVSGLSDSGLIRDVVQLGIDGYIVKDSSVDVLREGVELVARGGAFFDPTATRVIRETLSSGQHGPDPLTPRERRILELIADGYPSKAIAQMLSVSVKTIENQRSAIMKKLGITTIAGLTRYAVAKGLVTPGMPPKSV